MSDKIQIGGDMELLNELSKELKAHGIDAEVLLSTFANQEAEAVYGLLKTAAGATAVWGVLVAFLKHRRGRVVLDCGGDKVEVEGKNTKDTLRLLQAGVLRLKKIREQKDETTTGANPDRCL